MEPDQTLPLIVSLGAPPRIPYGVSDGVVLVIGTEGARRVPLGRRSRLDWREAHAAVVIGDQLLDTVASQPWHTPAFAAYLISLATGNEVDVPTYSPRDLWTLAERMQRELSGRRPGGESAAVALLIELLVTIYRDDTRCGRKAGDSPMARLLTYIHANYTEALTLEELAERCAMSPTHLSHRFRREIGRPLFAYINEVRIDRACVLLKRSEMPVVEVAYAVGYNSLSFFNRYFRRVTGDSPTEYRRKIGRKDSNIVVERPLDVRHTGL